MRLIHTADWHIGQTFYDYDRKEEHTSFFNWLKDQIAIQQVDLLVVSGDVYDNPNPSAESVRMFYLFLHQVTTLNPNLTVVVVAGNHDSASRLESVNPLLEAMNVFVRGIVKRNSEGEIEYHHHIIPIKKEGSVVAWCMAVPFLRQGDYPSSESYPLGVKSLYHNLLVEVEQLRSSHHPIIALGHLQATGSELSENDATEKRMIIGGVEGISPESFGASIAYTALGHLHKAQQVSKNENIRYSGAPLPMSFAEINYKQGVIMVDFEANKVSKIERLIYNSPVKLLAVPTKFKDISEVLEELTALPIGDVTPFSPFLEVRVLETEIDLTRRQKIEAVLQDKAVRLARISVTYPANTHTEKALTFEEVKAMGPLEIGLTVFRQRWGKEMDDDLQELLKSSIEKADKQ